MNVEGLIINYNDQMDHLNTLITILVVIMAINCIVNILTLFKKRT
ncbi:hypothetical protein [Alkalicoccobacillus murimartini]|uniref:Uncharacterized protein n=1 Tax=Alkalicoccobacillus murimartini TaxID=171685 RepID=A0ABT9YJ45_9BACI|nr:hypothetical protein [Alkalicoccobacillus murimartini]MDQ0207878.1 hypothetical protein [Alkalicoccobacillus murimartini]